MSRKAQPQWNSDEQVMMKQVDPKFSIQQDDDAAKQRAREAEMYSKGNPDLGTSANDFLLDNVKMGGAGYLTAGGYLRPPNARGGVLPLIPILSGLAALLLGSGRKKGGSMAAPHYYNAGRPLDMTSPAGFYRNIIGQALEAGAPADLVKKKFTKLFGGAGMFNKIVKGKFGGATVDKLKLGHLLAPIMIPHLTQALKGTGYSGEEVFSQAENLNSDLLDQEVSLDGLTKGGSILGTLWTGAKALFGKIGSVAKKIFTNPKVQDLASKAVNSVAKVAEERLPKLTESAANKLADYAEKKLKGPEPEVKPSKKAKRPEPEPESEEVSEEESEEEPEPVPKKKQAPRYVRATEKYEQPNNPPEEGTARRKRLIKSLIPLPPSAPIIPSNPVSQNSSTERRFLGMKDGVAIYGNGRSCGSKKKRQSGGAWTVKLVQG